MCVMVRTYSMLRNVLAFTVCLKITCKVPTDKPAHRLMRTDRFIFRPQGARHNRHIIDALWFDQWLANTDILRQPVTVRINGVIQTNDGTGAFLTDLELDGQNYYLEPGDRMDFNGDMFHRWRSLVQTTGIAVLILPPNPLEES